MIKIVTIVGARPQFIKAAAITRLIREEFKDQIIEIMVHTGQHFDKNMSSIFFVELEIPEPKYNLEISGGQHGAMTGRMLEAIEDVLLVENPDWVLIYGDTNSTLAGAIAASKIHIPVAHVEAGLRSFNMRMPEEINRIIADRISNLLLCPTKTSVENLKKEALSACAHLVGDVMYDVSLFYQKRALERSTILQKMGLSDGKYILTTCHRAENTDDPKQLKSIVNALASIAENMPVVFPIHPRTRKFLEKYQFQDDLKKVMLVEPLPYLDMVRLEQSAKVILTDSGGVQKEAFFYGVPCVTMRDETEWIETVDTGWNTLTGADTEAIIQAFLASDTPPQRTGITPYGQGNASELCLKAILQAQTTC
jgi:UDP-GlcNAc3NAcA epimerase